MFLSSVVGCTKKFYLDFYLLMSFKEMKWHNPQHTPYYHHFLEENQTGWALIQWIQFLRSIEDKTCLELFRKDIGSGTSAEVRLQQEGQWGDSVLKSIHLNSNPNSPAFYVCSDKWLKISILQLLKICNRERMGIPKILSNL